MPKVEQQGFLTIAQNNQETNYLQLAYVQAISIKLSMPKSKYAVVVDDVTYQHLEQQHLEVFDHVIQLPVDYAQNDHWKLANEWQVFKLSPFKETIKLESDLLITRNISHWWNIFRHKNIVLSLGCQNYLGEQASNRRYRRLFDDNALPDVYSGLMYFRFDKEAFQFFNLAKDLFENWDVVSKNLKNYRDEVPSTDVVYALAAMLLGVEKCTLPSIEFLNFVHMKNSINDWPEATAWPKMVMSEIDPPMIRLNNVNQYQPCHYQDKNWLSKDIVYQFEEKWKQQNQNLLTPGD